MTRPTIVWFRLDLRLADHAALTAAASGPLKGILRVCAEPLVSSDFNGSPYSSIVDLPSTMVMDGTMVKVLSWYDNESGFSNRMLDLAALMGKSL
jgi:glyceraldehyde 3-phosphate dehydrogenase